MISSIAAVALALLGSTSPIAHRTVEMDGTNHHLTLVAPTTITEGVPVPVGGRGYNSSQGIFVALCAIPSSVSPSDPSTFTARPTPCLGPQGAGDTSHRVANGATGEHTSPYGPNGSFSVRLMLRPQLAEGVECDVTVRCAIVTRADFTATEDRRLDLYVPVHFGRK